MRTKNEFYTALKIDRELLEPEPTFTPSVNRLSETKQADARTREEVILEKGRMYDQRKQEKMQLKQMLTDPELTFKPKINDKMPPKMTPKNTFIKLHEQAEQYQSKRIDRQKDTIEWAKEPEEYTFKPVILGDRRAGKQMDLFQRKKIIEDGPEDAQDVSVFVAVTIGKQKHRITLTKESNAQQLAMEFAKKHNLSSKLADKLQEQLALNIKQTYLI